MNQQYNLEERVSLFSESLIGFLKTIEISVVTKSIIDQLVRSGTSIGANYYEANGAASKKDFKNKIHICKKEAKETLYWLRLLGSTIKEESIKIKCRLIWKEAHELTLIFSSIAANTK